MITHDGWIYAAREDGTPLVKIGCTANLPRLRLPELRRKFRCPLSLVGAVRVPTGTVYVERAIHRILAPQHIEKEWFYLHMDQDTLTRLVLQARVLLGLTEESGVESEVFPTAVA